MSTTVSSPRVPSFGSLGRNFCFAFLYALYGAGFYSEISLLRYGVYNDTLYITIDTVILR